MNEIILQLNTKYNATLNKFGVDTQLKRVHFFTQIYHESKCVPQAENLNYSAKALTSMFGKYFKDEDVNEYARKPEKIANKIYGGRYGNVEAGDGWKFRGRGFIQTTFKGNYQALATFLKNPEIVENPDLLLTEATAMVAALYYWMSNKINAVISDDNDLSIQRVRKKVNGGLTGLSECEAIFKEINKLKLV